MRNFIQPSNQGHALADETGATGGEASLLAGPSSWLQSYAISSVIREVVDPLTMDPNVANEEKYQERNEERLEAKETTPVVDTKAWVIGTQLNLIC